MNGMKWIANKLRMNLTSVMFKCESFRTIITDVTYATCVRTKTFCVTRFQLLQWKMAQPTIIIIINTYHANQTTTKNNTFRTNYILFATLRAHQLIFFSSLVSSALLI